MHGAGTFVGIGQDAWGTHWAFVGIGQDAWGTHWARYAGGRHVSLVKSYSHGFCEKPVDCHRRILLGHRLRKPNICKALAKRARQVLGGSSLQALGA
eukprot:975408-Pelagomonas_calceolata.AAC.3